MEEEVKENSDLFQNSTLSIINKSNTLKPQLISQYKCQEMDPIIRFRSLNRDHNFIFIKNKNTIQIIEPIKLVQIYSFHHNELIEDFAIESKTSSLIICTESYLEIYALKCANLSDYELKVKFELHKSLNSENNKNISLSSLGDCIVTVNKHRGVKLYDMELRLIANLGLDIQIVPKDQELFPLDVFQITYDTRTIICCKYNLNKLSFIYKSKVVSEEENKSQYQEKLIYFKNNIIYLKEYQKSFSQYVDYQDSSLFFMLTSGLNFLIVRKIYEIDNETYDHIPNTMILLYIDLSAQTDSYSFPSISFSLLYDNENPIFKSDMKQLDDFQSGIVSMDNWNLNQNKNTLAYTNPSSFLNYNTYFLKNISCDFLFFNLNESLVMYQVNGLQSPPFNNPTVDKINVIHVDNTYESSFVMLKITKTLDENHSFFFIDKYSALRKYIIKANAVNTNNSSNSNSNSNSSSVNKNKSNEPINELSIIDTKRVFTIFKNIVFVEYNEKNRKTFIYEKQDNYSLISIINSKHELSKMIIVKEEVVDKIHWIKDSNFIIFNYLNKKLNAVIAIVHIYSKHFDQKINVVTNEMLLHKHIYITPAKVFRMTIENIIDMYLESPSSESSSNEIIDKKADKANKSYNDIKFNLLLKGTEIALYCALTIETTPSNAEDNTKEYQCSIVKEWEFAKSMMPDGNEWNEKEFAFSQTRAYFYQRDIRLRLFNILEINSEGETKTIFQTVIFNEFLYSKLYFNNYVIYITSSCIHSYDIENRLFYRVKNDYVTRDQKTKALNVNLDLFKCGMFVCLLFLSTKGIKLLRLPRNKNPNEHFCYDFLYKFSIGKCFSQINLQSGMAILNETQMESLAEISTIKHNLMIQLREEALLLLNSNGQSLFDCETFLDFFLSNNEEIIKLLLNIFCEYYVNNHTYFTDAFKNSKLIPNLFELNSIDYIIKIIFDNDITAINNRNNSGSSCIHQSQLSSSSSNIQDKSLTKMQIDNAILKFKAEEDDQEQNPINLWCSKSTNLTHMKLVYDLISSESTRNIDNFTKYFILKIRSKKEEFISKRFKQSTADLCWLYLINNQEPLLKFITDDQVKSITWDLMTMFNIPIWIKSDVKLKELLECVGRNEYKKLLKEEYDPKFVDKTAEKNYVEKVALYFHLANKDNLIKDFIEREQNDKIKQFIQRDFSIAKNRRIAKENADLLVNKKKYIYAAYFYLLADDIRSAIDMTLEKMNDINLTICVLRLVKSKYGNDNWVQYYSLSKIFQEYFINFGTIIRDPWLVVYGYLGQNKIDLALEYLLNYDIEYSFNKNEQVFENLDEFNRNLEIITRIFGLNVFDYKVLLFAKNLEKLYLTQYEESKAQVKNVQNTNFEDLWDLDHDDDDNNSQDNNNNKDSNSVNSNSDQMKSLVLDYKNLARLSLMNSLKRGVLYAPVLSLYKTIFENNFEQLTTSQRDSIKLLISNRIILDSLFTYNKPSIEKYFNESDTFINYFETSKIIKKSDVYDQMIYGFLRLDEYQTAHIPCFKSNKSREALIWVTNYIEKLMNKHLFVLSNFNFNENINLRKIIDHLQKFLQVSFFLVIVLAYSDQSNSSAGSSAIQKEKNLYSFRIIFMMYCYLLFVAKSLMKYSIICDVFMRLEELVNHHKKIEQYTGDYSNAHIAEIINLCNRFSAKLTKAVSNQKKSFRDEGLSFFIQFYNNAIINQMNRFLNDNKHLEINRIKHSSSSNSSNNSSANDKEQNDHYIHEEFKFIQLLSSLMKSYLDNFKSNMDKYIKNYMKSDLIIDIHNQLKDIYIDKKGNRDKKNKELINIKALFSQEEDRNHFEEKFKIGSTITKYMSLLCKQFRYSLKQDNDNSNAREDTNNSNRYTSKSICHIQEIFKKGFEVATFPENSHIQDFAINACDMSNFAISVINSGQRKVNILYNFLVHKRSKDLYQLIDSKDDANEDLYKQSTLYSFKDIIEEKLHNSYNEILSIINSDVIARKRNTIFPSKTSLPPLMFNEIPSNKYEEDISLNDTYLSSNCKMLEAHPQLPLYLSSYKGTVSLWSFDSDSKKSLDEFCIEKPSKDIANKASKNLTRLKFNAYGNEFLACDQQGNLFIWAFDHVKSAKTPKISLWKNERVYSRDGCFLNNSGVIGSTNNKGTERHNSMLWDLLLPTKKQNVSQCSIGGNFIFPIASDASFAVCNHTPGAMHFIDIRKMEVVKEFQAHQSEIKAVKISEREKYMVTMGKDSLVKIWDISKKSDPSLVESFEAFSRPRADTKSHFHLEIVNDLLFASKDNSIKLLRNKLF